MRRFALVAALTVTALCASVTPADAQVVIGTQGYGGPGITAPLGFYSPGGYYSPYPGTMYSPFARGVTVSGVSPTVINGYHQPPGVIYGGYSGYPHHYNYGASYGPRPAYNHGPYRRW